MRGAELIIHNAAFDVEFLDLELERAGPGQARGARRRASSTRWRWRASCIRASATRLDALCERYAIDNAHRTLHGALLDARLLAEVYLALTRGQESLVMELEAPSEAAVAAARVDAKKLTVLRATEEEVAAHEKILDAIDKAAKEQGGSLWRRLLNPS